MEFVKKQDLSNAVAGKVDNCNSALASVREFHTDPKNGNVSVIFADDGYDVIGVVRDTSFDYDKWRMQVVPLAIEQNQPVRVIVVYDVDKENPTPSSDDDLKMIRDFRVSLYGVQSVYFIDAIAVGRDGLAYTYASEHTFKLEG